MILCCWYVCKILIAVAPGVKSPHKELGTPVAVAGLVMSAAGTVVFPATLPYLAGQVRLSSVFGMA